MWNNLLQAHDDLRLITESHYVYLNEWMKRKNQSQFTGRRNVEMLSLPLNLAAQRQNVQYLINTTAAKELNLRGLIAADFYRVECINFRPIMSEPIKVGRLNIVQAVIHTIRYLCNYYKKYPFPDYL